MPDDISLTYSETSRDRLLLSNDVEPLNDAPEDEYYEGPTTNSEIFGWCLYSWATEPFIVSAVSTYVPLLLEQFARDSGVLENDHSKSCKPTPIEPLPPAGPGAHNQTSSVGQLAAGGAYMLMRRWEAHEEASKKAGCVVEVFGRYVDPSSFTLYVFSFSVFLQTLVVISITGFADKGNYKKSLLLLFGFLGALSTMAFYGLDTENYYKAGLCCIFANVCFGVVGVCGNSFLPILVENYPKDSSEEAINGELENKGVISSRISGLCSGLGYLAALIVQILTMFLVIKTGSKISSLQYAIFFVGAWWLIFLIPLIWLLKSRKVARPISLTRDFLASGWKSETVVLRKLYFFKEYIKIGWSTLFLAFHQIRLLKDVSIFLLGWFVISDSVTTINSAAILFSKTELDMKTPELAVIGILSIIFAIAGTILIPTYINKKWGVSLKNTLILIIMWSSFIPFYGILGFFFSGVGLKHKFEMYGLACWYGLALGGLSTVSRSLFGLLIPKGKESLFFALFAVTDKGSSILGPFVVGLITDKTHNIRHCFWFLWVLLIISLPIFYQLDVGRGKQEADKFLELKTDEEEN